MPTQRIGTDAVGSSGVSFQLQQVTFNSIRKVLPDHAIEQACQDVKYTYRRRVLTPIVTMLHMILATIWPEESFQAGWQLLWDNAVGAFPSLQGKSPSSGSLAKARARLPLALWTQVWKFLAARVEALSEPFACWHGHRVILADGTCLSMPDTPQLHAYFGTSAGRGGPRHYPLARMVTIALANTMSVLAYAAGRYDQSEQALLRPLLGGLRKGDLLVADRHFAGANLYAEYTAIGLHFLTRVHQIRYAGFLASRSKIRHLVIPDRGESQAEVVQLPLFPPREKPATTSQTSKSTCSYRSKRYRVTSSRSVHEKSISKSGGFCRKRLMKR